MVVNRRRMSLIRLAKWAVKIRTASPGRVTSHVKANRIRAEAKGNPTRKNRGTIHRAKEAKGSQTGNRNRAKVRDGAKRRIRKTTPNGRAAKGNLRAKANRRKGNRTNNVAPVRDKASQVNNPMNSKIPKPRRGKEGSNRIQVAGITVHAEETIIWAVTPAAPTCFEIWITSTSMAH